MTATPAAAAAPGHVVRLRINGGLSYSSPRMTAAEAEDQAKHLGHQLFLLGDGSRFVEFEDQAAGRVLVRANRVTAIEARAVVGSAGFAPGSSS